MTDRWIRSFDDSRLYTRETGAGPAVVLVDGLGCDGFVWKYLEPMLAERHRVVRFHHRGHGQSEALRDASQVNVEQLLGDLRAVLDAYELEKPVLFGHSMGVQLILEHCLRHPEQVTALVAICGSFGAPLRTFHDRPLLNAVFPGLLALTQRNHRVVQRLWSGVLGTEAAYRVACFTELNGKLIRRPDVAPLFEHLARMDVRSFLGTLNAINAHSTEDQLHRIDQPTLVVGGGRDRFTPAWLSERMHQLIPGSVLLMIADGSHAAPIERPELLEASVRRFLAALPQQSAAGAAPTVRPPLRAVGT